MQSKLIIKKYFILILTFCTLTFNSCDIEKNTHSEDYEAIAITNQGNKIKIDQNQFIVAQKIRYILFIYHDTIFQAEINRKSSKLIFSFLSTKTKLKDSFNRVFSHYSNKSLNKQLQSIKKSNRETCAPHSYILIKKKNQSNFCLFNYGEYYEIIKNAHYKEIKLPKNKIPAIYFTIYHTLNSNIWDYFMSNESEKVIEKNVHF